MTTKSRTMTTKSQNSSEEPKDQIYAAARDEVSGFTFDDEVSRVFPDMIQRSVPGYQTIIHMIGQIAERYAQADSQLYDLGCSLGASTLSMRHRVNAAKVKIIAVDNSPAMAERCKDIMAADSGPVSVDVICDDITNIEIRNASVCVMNFTLQFIPLAARLELLRKIAQGLRPGGVLVLSEKLAFEDQEHHHLMTELHHNFKRQNGYSDLEIAQKRSALENVLIPEQFETHKQRLKEAGFRNTELWFQCFNFSSMIAFK